MIIYVAITVLRTQITPIFYTFFYYWLPNNKIYSTCNVTVLIWMQNFWFWYRINPVWCLRYRFASILWKEMNLELIFSFHRRLYIWMEDSFISTVSFFTMHCIRQLLQYTDFVVSYNVVCTPWWLLDGKDVYFHVNNKL
jgi:hypothetical protein